MPEAVTAVKMGLDMPPHITLSPKHTGVYRDYKCKLPLATIANFVDKGALSITFFRNKFSGATITVTAKGNMTTVSRLAIIFVSVFFLLLLVIQFEKLNDEHILVPDSYDPHPDVILSDPGGPLLVSKN